MPGRNDVIKWKWAPQTRHTFRRTTASILSQGAITNYNKMLRQKIFAMLTCAFENRKEYYCSKMGSFGTDLGLKSLEAK